MNSNRTVVRKVSSSSASLMKIAGEGPKPNSTIVQGNLQRRMKAPAFWTPKSSHVSNTHHIPKSGARRGFAKKRKIKLPTPKKDSTLPNETGTKTSPYIAPPQPGSNANMTNSDGSKTFRLAYVHHSSLGSIDYTHPPPIRKTPPPPPPRPGKRRMLLPITLMITLGTIGYFYLNNQNDNYAYWEAMQSGGTFIDDDEDDFDDDEEE